MAFKASGMSTHKFNFRKRLPTFSKGGKEKERKGGKLFPSLLPWARKNQLMEFKSWSLTPLLRRRVHKTPNQREKICLPEKSLWMSSDEWNAGKINRGNFRSRWNFLSAAKSIKRMLKGKFTIPSRSMKSIHARGMHRLRAQTIGRVGGECIINPCVLSPF